MRVFTGHLEALELGCPDGMYGNIPNPWPRVGELTRLEFNKCFPSLPDLRRTPFLKKLSFHK